MHHWIPTSNYYNINYVEISDIYTEWDGHSSQGRCASTGGIELLGNGGLDEYCGTGIGNRTEQTVSFGPQLGLFGIWGCDLPVFEDFTAPWLPYTCGGTVMHTWELLGEWRTTSSTTLTFGVANSDGERFAGGAQCTVGVDCMSVVPEPSTWVLMATGLLGLAWVARRRRDSEVLSE